MCSGIPSSSFPQQPLGSLGIAIVAVAPRRRVPGHGTVRLTPVDTRPPQMTIACSMALPRLLGLLLWTVPQLPLRLPVVVAAASPLLNPSSDTIAFIPACARGCFASFLDVNYAASTCGPSPSLACLCGRVGLSGFTLGEGALQCITAETSIGSCRGGDAGGEFLSVHVSLW